MPEQRDDIEKYLNGELSPKERNRLEKKALSDPFLRQALEGGESLPGEEFSADMDQIRHGLEERTLSEVLLPAAMEAEESFASARVSSDRIAINKKLIPQKRISGWPLGIAAGILIVAAVIFLTGKLSDESKVGQLALQKPSPPAAENSLPEAPKTSAEINEPPHQPLKKDRLEPLASSKNASETPGIKNEETVSDKVIAPQPEAESELKGNQSSRAAEDKSQERVMESEADKTLTDDTAPVPVQKYSDQTAGASAPAPSRSLSRKKTIAAESSVSKDDTKKEIANEVVAPSPVDGFLLFTRYVEDHLRYPPAARNNNIEGDVTIDFQIDANGNSENFTIVKGLGFGCDEEAIRLIKEGPKWNLGSKNTQPVNTKSRVTIPFRLKK